MFTFNKIATLDRIYDSFFVLGWDERFIFIFFQWLLEQKNAVIVDQKLQKVLLLFFKEGTSRIFEHTHLHDFLMIVSSTQITISLIHNNCDPLFYILEGFKRF